MVTTNDDELSPEQWLALAYVPPDRRDALGAVWALDARMRRMFAGGREAMVFHIKLAWWGERVAELRAGHVPAEPLLTRLAEFVDLPDARTHLIRLIDGWRELTPGEAWTRAMLDAHAAGRGRALVALAGTILRGVPHEALLIAGEGYALADLARIAPDAEAETMVKDAAVARFAAAGRVVWPKPLRPVGMLVALARRDVETDRAIRPGAPERIARMAWHALSGR